jgi:hypothetical protein
VRDHDDNKKKESGGKKSPVDMTRCEERSWIQSRSVELIKVIDPIGNSFTSSDWSRCYKQAKEEWEKQHG